MLHSTLWRPIAMATAVAACTAALGLAQAATQPSQPKGKPPGSVRFIDAPSAESPAARKKRLQKECKGRPNAGACLGMTRPN